MMGAALVGIAAAMLLVRLGWGGRRGAAAAGWAVAVGALLLLAAGDGAWGLAMGTVAGMVSAMAIVLWAGWAAPAMVRRPVRERPSVTLPRQPSEIVRRLFVFVLVVPVAFAAAQCLAFGIQALARRAGAGEADAIVLALFLQPLLWAGLMTWQMTQATAGRMFAPAAGVAVLGTALWSLS